MMERGPKDRSEIRQPATMTTGRATAAERVGGWRGNGHGDPSGSVADSYLVLLTPASTDRRHSSF